jgi:hypothetical protein
LVGAGELYLLVVAWSSSCLGFRRYALIIDRKSLFSSIFGKLTKKTFARAYNQVRGIAYSGLGTPGLLLCPHGCVGTLERCAASSSSRAERQLSRWRVDAFESSLRLECF